MMKEERVNDAWIKDEGKARRVRKREEVCNMCYLKSYYCNNESHLNYYYTMLAMTAREVEIFVSINLRRKGELMEKRAKLEPLTT